jgi:hypothetical protein
VLLLVLLCIVSVLSGVTNRDDSDNKIVIHAVLAQDLATHGYYTEPNTKITFYTSSEQNGTITGDGEFSEVTWGGYTWGIALPANAATVDSFDYIGLIVSQSLATYTNISVLIS